MRKSEYLLYSETEAKYFTDAYPVGNGKLGGMVYGGTSEFKIGLNHDELYAMGETNPLDEYDETAFKRAQSLALNGNYAAAEKTLENGLMKSDSAAYLPFGDMIIDMPKGEISNYTRTLNLKTAVANVSYLLDGKRVSVDTIASYKDNVIAVKLSFEKECDFAFKVRAAIDESVNYIDGGVVVRGRCYATTKNHTYRNSFPRDRINAPTVAFSGAVKIITDGTQNIHNGKLEFLNVKNAEIYFSAATSYKNGKAFVVKNYEKTAVDAVEKAAEKGFDEVLKTHLKDYKRLYDNAAEISLGSGAPKTLVTEKRIENFEKGEKDFDLITLAFNYGKYLLISGSRKGSRALNLQGVWNPFVNAPWSSAYTTNINTEMNYWPALPLGLAELLEPLETEIGLIYKNGKLAAKRIFNSDGVCASHNSDIFGYAYFVAGRAQYSFFPLSIHWLARELYEKYLYTNNINYLKKIYPLYLDLIKFINDTLIFDGKYYIFAPATSAENEFYFDGKAIATARSTEFFAAIIRDTARCFIEMSEILGETKCGEYEKIKSVYDKLLPPLITPDGRIAEWYFGDGKNCPEEVDVHHRHVSNLFAMFPTGEITYKDKKYAEAVKKSLDTRGDESTGWSLTWKMNLRARLHDGEGLSRLFKLYFHKVASSDSPQENLHGGGVYANLFCSHPPFQIDGNFGITRAITEMLVQNVGGELCLCPALIPELTDGKIRRVRLKGGKKIDFDIIGGKAENVKIY